MPDLLHPPDWPRPKGYSNGIAATGQMVFVAGQVGWDPVTGVFPSGLVDQVRQALLNTVAVLNEAGASPSSVVRMTWYITDKAAYLANQKEIGAVYREVMGSHYPAMAMVVVAGLIEDQALVEIETTAVV